MLDLLDGIVLQVAQSHIIWTGGAESFTSLLVLPNIAPVLTGVTGQTVCRDINDRMNKVREIH